jgi:hypothetical protein
MRLQVLNKLKKYNDFTNSKIKIYGRTRRHDLHFENNALQHFTRDMRKRFLDHCCYNNGLASDATMQSYRG